MFPAHTYGDHYLQPNSVEFPGYKRGMLTNLPNKAEEERWQNAFPPTYTQGHTTTNIRALEQLK